ncbi:hypothetical protein SAMN05216226_103108 [Halovenus aranensis]|jgi:hypothetical protein|uniref:Transcriptional regulator n=1 Tax=Halovenus aranensis TaxID=890420 RepID=A0A1G8TJN5_9EURY|nr:hypothetical protein [Halovenus aranensis]SDJ41762.1 hypothetical protein SAMN05216226_103108 [Halovenus aranensis]
MSNQQYSEGQFDDALDALAHVQRRKLLLGLLDHNPQDDSPDLSVEHTDAVKRLVEMEHVHLPKLAEYGFITWDREQNEVAKGPEFDDIRPLIELIADNESELPDAWA